MCVNWHLSNLDVSEVVFAAFASILTRIHTKKKTKNLCFPIWASGTIERKTSQNIHINVFFL